MKETELTGILRTEDFGSAGSRRVLASGRIPAVIYGKKEPVHITLDSIEFHNKIRHFSESTLLEMKVGTKKHSVLMKAYQENVLRGEIYHVDFFEVTKGTALRTNVPLILEGNPEGARFGGVLEQVAFEVEVESLPKDLPRHIVVDVSALGLNESISVEEIPSIAGVTILTPGDYTVASVRSVREEVEEPAEDEDILEAVSDDDDSDEATDKSE
ncbi:MAG: 50S ribosomal protein L25 [Sphaerochaetaceae bacterium]